MNTTLATAGVIRGYWRLSGRAKQTYRCDGSHCVGGLEAGRWGSSYCAANYSGPKCEVCVQPDEYYEKAERQCARCPTVSDAILKGLVTIPVIIVALICLIWLIVRFQG